MSDHEDDHAMAQRILGDGTQIEFWDGKQWVLAPPHDHDLDVWAVTPCVFMEHANGDVMFVRQEVPRGEREVPRR